MADRIRQIGFTLIEVMICLAIVGILLAVAWPVLTDSLPPPASASKPSPANFRGVPGVSCKDGLVVHQGSPVRDPYGQEITCD